MTNNADTQYLDLCRKILAEGTRKPDRTGTGVISYFGAQLRFNLAEGFPLLTTKRVPFRIIAEELLWFLRGETDIKPLLDRNVHIWDADAYRDYVEKGGEGSFEYFVDSVKENGYNLGPIYGSQWRSWTSYDNYYSDFDPHFKNYDQIAQVIESIRNNPDSRRHIVSAWNVGELDEMALPPCHVLFQFYVANGKLSCQLYQRSADVFLGLPFNIASYALLTHIIAKQTGLEVGEFIHTIGDAHVYSNHLTQIETQLAREPRKLPQLAIIKDVDDPAEYEYEDFALLGYDPHDAIKGAVSVGL